MASNLATPGVFIEEKSSFGNSIVSVPTSVPAFVGYTKKAMRGTKSLLNIPTKINSIGQYVELFGGAPSTKFEISYNSDGSPCLLYTSPSPRDKRQSRMPSSA